MPTAPVTLQQGEFEDAPAASSQPVQLSAGEFEDAPSAPAASTPITPPKDTLGDFYKEQKERISNAPLAPSFPKQPALPFAAPPSSNPADAALEQSSGASLQLRSNAPAPTTIGEQVKSIQAGSHAVPVARAPLSQPASRVPVNMGANDLGALQQGAEQGREAQQQKEQTAMAQPRQNLVEGSKNVYEGAGDLFGQTGEDFDKQKAIRGLAKTISGGGTVAFTIAAPEILSLGALAAGGDISAQVAIAKISAGYAAGAGASSVAGKASDALKLSPDAKELLQTVAFFTPSLFGLAKAKEGYVESPNAETQAYAAGTAGGKVRVAAGKSPEAYEYRAAVGDKEFGVRIPRGPQQASPPPPEPAAVLGAQEADAGTNAIIRATQKQKQAAQVVAGGPPPPPPGPPRPDPNGAITQKTVEHMASAINAMPQESHAQLILEAHANLAKDMLQQGTFTGPDGKISVVENPQQASKLAQKVINDEIDRQHKTAEDDAKAKSDAIEQQKKEATTPGENGELSPADKQWQRAKTLIESTTLKPGQTMESVLQRNLRVGPSVAREMTGRHAAETQEAATPTVGSKEEPVVEESRATVDAQLEALKGGNTKVVMLPEGSRYIPKLPEGMKMMSVDKGPGAGKYIYDPKQIRAATIKEAAKAGTHGDLLGHLSTKEEIENAPDAKVVQAVNAEGTPIQDSVVTPDRVEEQAQVLQERHPEATIAVKAPEEVLQQRQEEPEAAKPVELAADEFEEAPEQTEEEQDDAKYQQQRTELRAEAEKRFANPYDNDLYDALNSFNRAGRRWVTARETGLSDTDLLKSINTEMGVSESSGRFGGQGYSTRPGKFWRGDASTKDKPTLAGPALVKEVRRLMDIPQPNEVTPKPQTEGGSGQSPEPVEGGGKEASAPAPKEQPNSENSELREGSPAVEASEPSPIKKGDLVTARDLKGKDQTGKVAFTDGRIVRIKTAADKEITVKASTVKHAIDHSKTSNDVEKEEIAVAPATPEEENKPNEPGDAETAGRREAADTGSANPEAVADRAAGLPEEPASERNSEEGNTERGVSVPGPDEPVSDEGIERGSGEGSDSALDSAPGQRVVKEANKNLAKTPKLNQKWFSHPDNWQPPAGVMGKLDANIRALQLLREVEKTPRPLTDDEKHELSQFVGWGALQHAFDPWGASYDQRERFQRANRELSNLLNPDEFSAARKSTLNAHYTSPELVRAMWDIAKRFGFKGGNILEPSMGSGNFFGMMPKSIRNAVSAMGNELDPITAGIAKLLYPDATIFNKDFVQLIIPDNSIDLAISNVPFGGKIYDPQYPKLNAQIHDYFFVKSLDKLKPGGVMAFITSTGTMDKPSDSIREALASKADLLGAIRFPSGAFAKNAGTAVTTDLILLQKRAPGQTEKHAGDWMRTVEMQVPDDVDKPNGKTHKVSLNEYFDKNPNMMLGRPGVSQMYSRSGFALYPHTEGNIKDALDAAVAKLPRGVMLPEKATSINQAETVAQFANQSQLEGQYIIDSKGNLRQVVGGKLEKPEVLLGKDGSVNVAKSQRLKAMVGVREEMNELLSRMTTEPDDEHGNSMVAKQRDKLAKEYAGFVKKYGYLSTPQNNVMEDDPHYPRLLALETYDKATKIGTPADILQKRTVFPRVPLTAVSDDPKDALSQILAERGYADIELMAQLQGKDPAEVAKGLIEDGLIYRDPQSGGYQVREKYLSGYVRDKLDYAKAAVAQGLKEFQPNVDALTKIQPEDIPIADIDIKLGATWIPIPALQDFARETFAQPWDTKITYTSGAWSVSRMQPTAEATAQFGTSRVSAGDLMEMALNQKEVTVSDKDSDGKSVVNQADTLIARQKQQAIRDQLDTWAQGSKKWATSLARAYNYAYNNIVLPEYDGSHLTFPGMSAAITLNPHQVNAVWRLLSEGRGLLAHAVGAGKTFEGVAFVMEARRTGIFRKPVINVPNHLVEQWRKEWMQLYPGANILVPSEKDFDAKNRQRLMAKIATSDFDAVIMARSQFDRFDISPERQAKTIQDQMDELLETLQAMKAGGQDQRTVKQQEKSLEALKVRMEKLADSKKDKVINFDDTGIDLVLTDEAHDYKNLAFYTKMTRIAGLSQGDAKRALSMKAKMDYLLERNNYKGVVFATGTPVQNTMAEQYNMTKYVAPDVLQKAGIKFFDDWAANFGSVRTVTEVAADGRSFKQRQKFSRFTNVPELMRMFRSFADIKTAADLNLPVPKLEGGKPSTNLVPPSDDVEQYIKALVKRAETVRSKNPKEDNMLKITGDGRKAATDMRLIDPKYKDDPDSKINQVVEDAYQEWKAGKDGKLTQMVFLDNYQAFDKESGDVRLDLYKDMKKKWVEMGVPSNEIAIIGDYDTKEKKQKLFSAMNNGDVRILMGSTAKMGAGTNAQRKLKVLHHVDLPWRPGDLEQRNGRIIRQGNSNKEVAVKNWLTRGSFDTYMLQALESKATFIEQLMNGRFNGRSMEDLNSDMSMNLQEMKIATSGNPDVKLKFDLEAESMGLYNLKRGWDRERADNIYRIGSLRKKAADLDAYSERMALAEKKYIAAKGDDGNGFKMRLDGKDFDDRELAGKYVDELEVPSSNFYVDVNGLGYSVRTFNDANEPILEITAEYGNRWDAPKRSMDSMLRSITQRQSGIVGESKEAVKDAADARLKADKLAGGDKEGFPQQARLDELDKQIKEVNGRLGLGGPKKDVVDEQIATEEDGDDPEAEAGEDETKPAKKETKGTTLRASAFGVDLLAKFMADQGAKLWEKEIAPHVPTAVEGFKKAAQQTGALLYPRIGANDDALDSLFKAKGEREKARFMLERMEGGLEKFFDKMPKEARLAFIDRYKLGVGQLDSKLQHIEDLMREIDKASFDRAQKYKPSMTAKEDHYRVLWKVIPDPNGTHGNVDAKGKVGIGRRPFEGDKGFMKRSTLDTISEGINYGGVPVSTNPWKMFTLAQSSIMQYITAQDHWADLKSLGLRKFVRPGQPRPEGWVKLDDRIAKAFFPAEVLTKDLDDLPNWKKGKGKSQFDVIAKEDVETRNAFIPTGEWYLEPTAGRILNNYLSRDLIRENAIGKALMAVKNLSTAIELGVSPFHFAFETVEAIGSQFGIGVQRFWNNGVRLGEGSEAMRGLKEIATSIAAPVLTARAGGNMVKMADNPTAFAQTKRGADFLKQYPDAAELLDDLFTGGYSWGMNPDFKFDPAKSMQEALTDKNYGGAMLRLIPWVNHVVMAPLFEHYIPRLKLGFALAQYSQQLAENSKELSNGDTTRAKIARHVVDTAENRFGEMNFSNILWNNTFKSLAQFLFRSITWKLGNWRGFATAAGPETYRAFADPIKQMIDDAKTGTKRPAGEYIPKLGMNQAWLLGMMAATAVLGTILTKIWTGKFPYEFAHEDKNMSAGGAMLLEFTHPRTGQVDWKTGKPERISLPTGFKDFEHGYEHPREYVRGSMSGTAGNFVDLLENRDFFGNYVYDPNAPLYQQVSEAVKYAAPKPIVVQSLTDKHGGQTKETKLLKFAGLAPSSRGRDMSDAEDRMQQILRARRTPMTPEQVKAREDEDAIVKAPTVRSMQAALRKGHQEYVQKEFTKMGYADARQVYYNFTTPAEQRILKPLMDKKRMALLHKNPDAVRRADAQQ